jgi:hypothetical protein
LAEVVLVRKGHLLVLYRLRVVGAREVSHRVVTQALRLRTQEEMRRQVEMRRQLWPQQILEVEALVAQVSQA